MKLEDHLAGIIKYGQQYLISRVIGQYFIANFNTILQLAPPKLA